VDRIYTVVGCSYTHAVDIVFLHGLVSHTAELDIIGWPQIWPDCRAIIHPKRWLSASLKQV